MLWALALQRKRSRCNRGASNLKLCGPAFVQRTRSSFCRDQRMQGQPPFGFLSFQHDKPFRSGVKTTLVPRLTFVSEHACAFSLCLLRAPVEGCIVWLSFTIGVHPRHSEIEALQIDSTSARKLRVCSAAVRPCVGKHGRKLQACPRMSGHVAAPCSPSWGGSLGRLMKAHGAKLHQLLGVTVSFEEYKRVSGATAIDAAVVQLNARLAARGAPLVSACSHGWVVNLVQVARAAFSASATAAETSGTSRLRLFVIATSAR